MSPETLHTETELLKGLRASDKSAFTQLYRMYSVNLYYNVFALVKDEHIAEEIVQDVFFRIWNQRETISIEKSFSAYLFVASRNRLFDFFRQLTRDRELYKKIKSIVSDQYQHIEEALFARENADLLNRAIASLPPQRRYAFELCKIRGLTYRQASEEMGISLSTLKDHMVNALEAVRQYVAKNMEVAGLLLFCSLFISW